MSSCSLSAAYQYSPHCESGISRYVVASTVLIVLLGILVIILIALLVALLVVFKIRSNKRVSFFKHFKAKSKVKKLAPLVNELKQGMTKESGEGDSLDQEGPGPIRDKIQLLDTTEGIRPEEGSSKATKQKKKRTEEVNRTLREDTQESSNDKQNSNNGESFITRNSTAISRLYSMLKERESIYSSGANEARSRAQSQTIQDLSYTFAAALSELAGSESLQGEKYVELSDPFYVSSDLSGGFNEDMFRLGNSDLTTSNT